jgi:hypothetical protein
MGGMTVPQQSPQILKFFTHPVDKRKQKAIEGLLRGRDVTKSATELNRVEIGTLERQA